MIQGLNNTPHTMWIYVQFQVIWPRPHRRHWKMHSRCVPWSLLCKTAKRTTIKTHIDSSSPIIQETQYLLRWSLVKNGCRRASSADILSEGSNFRSPCNRLIRSPAEWSTCCIIKFWSLGSFNTALILSLDAAPSGQSNLPLLTYLSACRLKNVPYKD